VTPLEQYAVLERAAGKHGHVDAVLLLFDRVAEERMWIGTEPGYDRLRLGRLIEQGIDDGQGYFVSFVGAELAGAIMTYTSEQHGTMIAMLVERQYRGMGIGRALVDAAVAWGEQCQVQALSLLVFPHNERALRLYRAAGFTEIQRFRDDVTRLSGEVWDTILMRKVLSP